MGRDRATVVGIGGGSGSGKSTFAKKLLAALAPEPVTMVELDSFYRDLANSSRAERSAVNFDHPDALDWELLLETLAHLRSGEPAEVPVYDFASQARADEAIVLEPASIIVVEGILCLAHEPLRAMLDVPVFVDTPADIRFIRRLRRDILDRDRSIDSVVDQYLTTVRPMHHEFVEPSRQHAQVVVDEGTPANEMGVELTVNALAERLRALLDETS